MTRRLQKWHGAGNDFLVDVQAGERDSFWNPARAAAVCAGSTGVGADGLLVATLAGGVAMTLYNADGSIAEMSGNGLRCLAAAVRRFTGESWATLRVRTDAGERTVALTMDGTSGYGETSMGEVTFGETLEGTWGVAYVGNPHAVVEDRAEWSSAHCEDLAAKLDAQLGGANVEFVTILAPGHVRIRVVERGVGWTQACGTGSCAVAAILRREGLAGDEVTVENPGGTLTVRLDGAHSTLAGPVQFVADVEWADA